MTWKTAVTGLLVAVATLAAAGGEATSAEVRVLAFSPAALHAGDAFVVDAEFAGRARPRVWVGRHPVPRSRIRVEDAADEPARRRIWARVPKRVPAGSHEIRVATRAGTSVAAKEVVVVSCTAQPSGCVIPAAGDRVDVTVTGAGGYRDAIRIVAAQSGDGGDPGETSVSACYVVGTSEYHCLSFTLSAAPADLHVGPVPATVIAYYDGNAHNWRKAPGGTVDVVEESPSHVGVCFDVVLPLVSTNPGNLPATVRVEGYVVIAR